MSKRTLRKGVCLLALLLALVVIALIAVRIPSRLRNYEYRSYVCSRCGADRPIQRYGFFGVLYSRHDAIKPTGVSRVIDAQQSRPCRHQWFRTSMASRRGFEYADYFGRGCRWLATMPSEFARDLSTMPDPAATWNVIFLASVTDPLGVERLFSPWVLRTPHPPLKEVWSDNEQQLRGLAARTRQKYPHGSGDGFLKESR
jgi:hypothetical protein